MIVDFIIGIVMIAVILWFLSIALASLGNFFYNVAYDKLRVLFRGGEILLILQIVMFFITTVLAMVRTVDSALNPSKLRVVVNVILFVLSGSIVGVVYYFWFPSATLLFPLLLIVAASDMFNSIATLFFLCKKK